MNEKQVRKIVLETLEKVYANDYDGQQLMKETATYLTGNLTEQTVVTAACKRGEFSLTVRHSLYPASLYLGGLDEARKLVQMIEESINWYESK